MGAVIRDQTNDSAGYMTSCRSAWNVSVKQ